MENRWVRELAIHPMAGQGLPVADPMEVFCESIRSSLSDKWSMALVRCPDWLCFVDGVWRYFLTMARSGNGSGTDENDGESSRCRRDAAGLGL
ncbi:hypothetical protein CA85_31760 [Allorhodopirellula solitaria]|uniref:Uncharacterized protein n=1 Tax=Allorhodopirellula solitaria TaxID=2527987 RepID=A0A5C5XQT5_9BACT|nr:hypothetical protein CA85_31760 [Allorhodopirellula solitaria]